MTKTRYVTFAALGTALYVALGFAVQVPVFENYYLYLGYAAMLAWTWTFGTGMGCIVGGAGCVLYCLLTSGLRGMPGWTLGNLAMAVIIGLSFKATMHLKDGRARLVSQVAAIALACTVGILLVKSFTEVVLYAQPMIVRMGKNVFAYVADLAVLEASVPLCRILEPMARRAAYGPRTEAKA